MYPDPGPLASESSDQMIRFSLFRFLSGKKVQFHLSRQKNYRKFHSSGKLSGNDCGNDCDVISGHLKQISQISYMWDSVWRVVRLFRNLFGCKQQNKACESLDLNYCFLSCLLFLSCKTGCARHGVELKTRRQLLNWRIPYMFISKISYLYFHFVTVNNVIIKLFDLPTLLWLVPVSIPTIT